MWIRCARAACLRPVTLWWKRPESFPPKTLSIADAGSCEGSPGSLAGWYWVHFYPFGQNIYRNVQELRGWIKNISGAHRLCFPRIW